MYRSADKMASTSNTIKTSNDVFRSSNEKLTAPNPIYGSAITRKPSDPDIAVDNPMYQIDNRRKLSYHEYESIHIDNLVAKHSAS